jgi:transketolase
VHEALKAADRLDGARVIDCYSIKPIDAATLAAAARDTGKLVVVEDHWPEGGLGEAVLAALAAEGVSCEFRHLAVRDMPHSGKSDELLAAFEIDAAAIVEAARN